jgi:phospholipid-translocating P-type ATPase (flippase)
MLNYNHYINMDKQDETNWREVKMVGLEPVESSPYVSNQITSTRYTWTSLVPKNLLEQFQRTANIWFLIVSVFQLIPIDLNATSSWSTILPLCILLTITLIKDAYNNYYHLKGDNLVNNTEYKCWDGYMFRNIKSKDILVGHFLKIYEGEKIPADLILVLNSSGDNNLFVNTSQTTGESDLKIKKIASDIQNFCNSLEVEAVMRKLIGIVKFEQPNNDYYSFNGKMIIEKYPRIIELGIDNMISKGSILHGTEWSIGIVLYTGSETKIYQNMQTPKKKISRMEKTVNIWVLYILVVLLILVTFSILSCIFLSSYSTSSILDSFIIFTVMYNNIIPISLFVTMDIVRVLQVFVMEYYSKKEIKFRTGDINEDIGQIEYILADKTGTITEDKLKLSSCIIDSVLYDSKSGAEHVITEIEENADQESKLLDLPQQDILSSLKSLAMNSNQNPTIYNFLSCMVLCNTVIPTNGKYFGTSPDEVAQVEAGETIGIKLLSRSANNCKVQWLDEIQNYQIIAQQAFSHSNKLSRVLMKDPNERAVYFVKAGYETLEEMVKIETDSRLFLEETIENMEKQGLRAIVLAYKELSPDELNDIEVQLESARSFPLNSEARVNKLFPLLENDMQVLGVVGIEEIVKKDTIESIKVIKDSGIKLWLLSGDSEGNTISTAQKSHIFTPETNIFRINKIKNEFQCIKILKKAVEHLIFHEDIDSISHVINFLTRKSTIIRKEESLDKFNEIQSENNSIESKSEEALSNHPMFSKLTNSDKEITKLLSRDFIPENLNYSLSIDRGTLNVALNYPETRKLLIALLFCADSVIFHGLLPNDKASVAKLLKENLDFSPIVLAIGDGDADIPIMQASDVAVNIRKKASQAASYCEVSISNFSQLPKLVVNYGYWNHYRMGKTILLFLYKNFVVTVAAFAYFCFSGYSDESIFDDSLLIGYNLFSTTIPLIVLGVFDFRYNDKEIENYSDGYTNKKFNYIQLLKYSVVSVVQGILCVLFVLKFFYINVISSTGRTENFSVLGTSMYICIVITVLLEMWFKTLRTSAMYIVSYILSLVLLLSQLVVITCVPMMDLYQIGIDLSESQTLILIMLGSPLVLVSITWTLRKTIKKLLPKFKKIKRLDQYSNNLNQVYRSTTSLKTKIKQDIFDFHKYSLKFYSEYIEKAYRKIYIHENVNILKLTIVILWFLLVCWTLLDLFLMKKSTAYIVTRVILCVGFTAVMAVSATPYFLRNYVFYTILIITASLLIKFAAEIAFLNIGALATGVIPSITYILFNVNWLLITYLNILSQVLILISTTYTFYNTTGMSSAQVYLIMSLMILNIAICVTSAIVGHNLEKNNRLEYKLIKVKELGVEKTQRILSFLLPSFVKKRVKNGIRYISEDQGNVTVLFCDIVDFESICAEYSPQELTFFLDSVFQKFDSLCSNNGVTKIETVGKTYMACAGLKDSESEIDSEIASISHCQRVLMLALSIVQEVKKLKLKNRKGLKVKIGINSGPVTAGVVGYHKPQFSLVGDTVNTASRMCSTLETSNKIQLSKASYELLTNHKGIYFTTNIVEAKGKGKMYTYIVNEGNKSNIDEAWLEISHLSSINPYVSSTHTYERAESLKKTRRTILSSFAKEDFKEFQSNDGLQKFRLCEFRCRDSEKLRKFHKDTLMNNKDMMKLSLLVACVSYTVFLLIGIANYLLNNINYSLLISLHITVAVLWLSFGLYRYIYLTIYYKILLLACMLLMLSQAILLIVYTDFLPDLPALLIMYIILILCYTSGYTPGKIICVTALILICWISLYVLVSADSSYIENSVLVIGFSLINIIGAFKRENQLRVYFNLKSLAELEIEKTDNLLTQMMPLHVLENMKNGKSVTDKFLNVTLLYADIVGFTHWSSDKIPEQVVGMLSELFTEFDKICVDHHVYKVHTIGDCYVVMGTMDVHQRDTCLECLNVINMGLSMIKVIEQVNCTRNSKLNMRIGVHTGEVIGGVIGSNIVRYDIYGPDVLIANKMESGGEPGKINVSEVTKALLEKKFPESFNYTFNKIIESKTINRSFKSYFLSPKTF